jgi:hypothetical protein
MVLAPDCKSESNTDQRDLEMRDLASGQRSGEKQTFSISVQSSGLTMPESKDTDSNGENEPQIQVIFDDSSTEIIRRSARAPARVRGIDDVLETELKDSTMPQ